MSFPLDGKYIAIAESELGVRFPESFRGKMKKLNGGEVEVGSDSFELHPFYDTSDKKRIKRTCNSIVHETKIARNHFKLPENLIVIGNNGSGDVLVFRVETNGTVDPKIYWFNHETEELVFVANEFSELDVG